MARPKINPEFATLACKMCNNEFQVKWQKRNIQKYCSKSCANKDPEVLTKMHKSQIKTSMEKYGVEHPMQTPQVVRKFKDSMVKKYGVESALQSKMFLDKSKRTVMQNYGVENVLSESSPIRAQILKTWMNKYGVDNPGKAIEVITKRSEKKLKNHFCELNKIFNDRELEWLTNMEDYQGYHFSKIYKFKCKKCNNGFESTVYVPDDVFCEKCHPEKKITGETPLHEFLVSELNGDTIARHNRTILEGKELDFYIPSKKFAIEYNGLYWHNDGHAKMSKNYHLEKTEKCESKGIRLIHVFENEWKHKSTIVKSIIRHHLGLNGIVISIKECDVKRICNQSKCEFLDTCDIQGNDRSSIAYGLFYKESLVGVMTFQKSRYDQKIEWEIPRYCVALNMSIPGGSSKIFSTFIQDYAPTSVVAYADRRYFSGNVYANAGMTFLKNTEQGYYYVLPNCSGLLNRQTFRKEKLMFRLKTFDPTLSEWENMKLNGFDRIWDCGHSKWIWTSNAK